MAWKIFALKCIVSVLSIFMGITALSEIIFATKSISAYPTTVAYIMFFAGIITFGVSCFGICGVCNKSFCLMSTFTVALCIMIIMQLINIALLMMGYNFDTLAEKAIKSLWEQEITAPGAMDVPQTMYKCCGKYRKEDYLEIMRPISNSCRVSEAVEDVYYEKGCIEAIQNIHYNITGPTDLNGE
ncbi:CD63 antigen-like isoform X2 [Teleopsis dalmanni]|uniref:CD63 antigen-like isoform X2 n=1 Tax=Teleopsis dalmanni TaxID=139649 RepID=UPI0018CF33A7|nr:CD63 antigen-like isoform X2 [Teleopsis dalmanni]